MQYAELEELPSKRKMKDNEYLDEHILNMKQLHSQGNVEESALLLSVINVIKYCIFKISILYGYSNIYEFKQKLKIYEKLRFYSKNVKREVDARPKRKPEVEFKNKSKPVKSDIRCYNYCNKSHKSIDCTNREQYTR